MWKIQVAVIWSTQFNPLLLESARSALHWKLYTYVCTSICTPCEGSFKEDGPIIIIIIMRSGRECECNDRDIWRPVKMFSHCEFEMQKRFFYNWLQQSTRLFVGSKNNDIICARMAFVLLCLLREVASRRVCEKENHKNLGKNGQTGPKADWNVRGETAWNAEPH